MVTFNLDVVHGVMAQVLFLGTVWCDNDIGEVVAASSVTPEGIDDCRFYKDYCEDCDGLGGVLIFGRGKY